jgi:hypothetical protein
MGLQNDAIEEFCTLPDAQIVLSRDGQTFVGKTLVEAAMQATDLFKLGYVVAGVVGTCADGIVRGIAERGCGQIIADAVAVFLYNKREAKRPVPPLAWLENLALMEDPRQSR